MKAPDFWRAGGGGAVGRAASLALLPAAAAFDLAGRLRRARTRGVRAGVPMLCVGNLVAGGSGKTPVVLSLARAAAARQLRPHLLLRGYGGRLAGPVRVDPGRHDAGDVGDEALLLARAAPTWVARRRASGAAAAVAAGAGLIILDDGFQNPSLVPDKAVIVVDAVSGFGNGRVIPAGPLRETVRCGLARADGVVVLGPVQAPLPPAVAAAGLPVWRAWLAPSDAAPDLAGRRVVAFAGIGRPQKFFDLVEALGADVVDRVAFADHHPYGPRDLARLAQAAQAAGARLVTTEKDAVRLPAGHGLEIVPLPVAVDWQDPASADHLITALLAGREGAR